MHMHDLRVAKEQIRQATDIVDLASGYLALHRQGRGFVGLCPWHDDSRPSLQVNPERQSFKCWVCDVGGDVFALIMRMENVDFREALEMLAERAGVSLQPSAAGVGSSPFERRNLFKAAEWVEAQYHRCLLEDAIAEAARRYLQQRGIVEHSLRRFRLGFAPTGWDWLLRRAESAGIHPEVLERIDCLVRRERGGFYDRFRGRLMFPIRDGRGRAIAFGGRVLPEFAQDGDAKYINSRETSLFSKSSNVYGLDAARDAIAREKSVVVMEGYTDVVMAHQHGVEHAVAVLGTALGERHVPLLKRYTDSITLVLDGDAAGKGRTLDILDNLLALFVRYELELKILTLPEGADPCDVISSQGRDAFGLLLAQAHDALTHKIEAVTNGLAPTADTHRAAQAVEAILATFVRALPRAAAASSPAFVRERQMLVRVGRMFGISAETLGIRLQALRAALKPLGGLRGGGGSDAPSRPASVKPTAWEREFLEVMLHHPESHEELLLHAGETDFAAPAARELFRLMRETAELGEAFDYHRLMLAVEDPELQNLLIDCDEQARRKAGSDLRQRVDGLIATLSARRLEPKHQLLIAELASKRLDPTHEDQALAAYFEELKSRQASVPPMDGREA
jgi:DNA primase